MFSRIADRYDLMNTIMTAGLHRIWRRKALALLPAAEGRLGLDVCSGTGDLAMMTARMAARVVAVDFCLPMLRIAKRKVTAKPGSETSRMIRLVAGDALSLPFPSGVFDFCTIGFSLRNVACPPGVWRTSPTAASQGAWRSSLGSLFTEFRRVLKPGGLFMSLEASRPVHPMLRAAHSFYMRRVLPVLGSMIDRSAYEYLARTVLEFAEPEEIGQIMAESGLAPVGIMRLAKGAAVVHLARVADAPKLEPFEVRQTSRRTEQAQRRSAA
jgi:demethylmenaquinone methyltransferase/2-methoxy-6-polyprenyl-1,4-benzoquinol methylase